MKTLNSTEEPVVKNSVDCFKMIPLCLDDVTVTTVVPCLFWLWARHQHDIVVVLGRMCVGGEEGGQKVSTHKRKPSVVGSSRRPSWGAGGICMWAWRILLFPPLSSCYSSFLPWFSATFCSLSMFGLLVLGWTSAVASWLVVNSCFGSKPKSFVWKWQDYLTQ